MKQILSSALFVSAVMVTACQAEQATKTTFSSEEGRFTIAEPAPFQEMQQSVETPVGPVEIYTFTAETDQSAYVVAFSDYPPQMVAQSEPEMLLDSSRDGAVNNLGGTLVSEEKIELAGNPGRSLTISADTGTNESAIINSHIYLVDNRLYQILVVSPENQQSKTAPKTFLESFSLE